LVRVTIAAEGGPGLEVVANALRAGGVAVVPSDTLYGFSARYDRPSAIRRIAAIKGRSEGDPFVVLVARGEELALLTDTPPPSAVIDLLWPGPVTLLLLGRAGLPLPLRGADGKVAVRWPRAPFARALVARVGVPIISTSVNRHGEPPLGDPEAIAAQFGAAIDVLADAGPCASALPSTIVDLTQEPPIVVRAGAEAVDVERLDRLLRPSP
jgi:L-threonylcarbamoyladenylate synthase